MQKIQLLIFFAENIQARVKRQVAKHNWERTATSVFNDVKAAIANITAEDWSRAIGNYFCEKISSN